MLHYLSVCQKKMMNKALQRLFFLNRWLITRMLLFMTFKDV